MDELGNTETSYFQPTEPEGQSTDRKKQENIAKAAREFIEQQIGRANQKIAHYNSVDAIPVDVNEDPLAHQKRVAIAQGMKADWMDEKTYLESLLQDR